MKWWHRHVWNYAKSWKTNKQRIKNNSLVKVFLTYVLAGKADHSACHIKGVLTPLQHAAKPIEGRILIGASHGLMQCRNTVEMLLTFGLKAKKKEAVSRSEEEQPRRILYQPVFPSAISKEEMKIIREPLALNAIYGHTVGTAVAFNTSAADTDSQFHFIKLYI